MFTELPVVLKGFAGKIHKGSLLVYGQHSGLEVSMVPKGQLKRDQQLVTAWT